MGWGDVADRPPMQPDHIVQVYGRDYEPTYFCRARPLDSDEDGFILAIHAEMDIEGELFLWGTYFDHPLSTLSDDEMPDERHIRVWGHEFWFVEPDGTDVFMRGPDIVASAQWVPIDPEDPDVGGAFGL